MYKQDPNNTKKQIPDVSPGGTARFSHATCPAQSTVTKRPSYVVINEPGIYKFLYETTSSRGEATGTTQLNNYVTGSSVVANHGNIKLDISPVAWRRTDAGQSSSVGEVTFVYVRVR